ncbi:hypothetical protein [uncultured Jatrophihabitans sp.]|uniref:SCO6745 family protein n=1 Tax=uncultured Jatrophihabitans sp. TaxID=1610747 RepID=UPI0035CA9921
MPTDLPAAAVARVHRSLESLHALIYFAPEADEEFTAAGLRPGRMGYFASRSAPMGAVAAGVTTAAFYNFNPSLVAHFIPHAWTLASPADVLAARYRAVDRALGRLLGAEADSDAVREAADLAQRATRDLPAVARPLYAGHADLDWPDGPAHVVLWHAITLLREFRGDGHVAALLDAEVSGIDAQVTHVATGRGFTEPAAKKSRGWSDAEWDAARESLGERGLLAADGALTEAGNALRARIEATTDRLSAAPWRNLDAAEVERLTELGKQLSRTVIAAGAFPPGVFASGH